MSIEPAVAMRVAAFDWDYEVQVALPASYEVMPDQRYPVLWLTDGPLMFPTTVGLVNSLVMGGRAPEMIIVGVGCAGEVSPDEYYRRRTIDLLPPGESTLFGGLGGEYLRKLGVPDDATGRADEFLTFLIDELRPALAQRYRMDGDDHGLFGHSVGGVFVNYAVFSRPGAFRRYIIGSPASNAVDRMAFKEEASYASAHTDLKADIFFGVGEQEIGQLYMAAWGTVSAPVLMAETLLLRQYPSLKVTMRVFPAKDYFTVVADLVSEGVQAVWSDKVGKPA
ncbi:alpha/beta hydrolase [Nesterenkonia ebinurensis]|uniref:alpha/beta hydrolase n=1 Tax=Nesterenkonia ebinurensis TaxID=2608252 RepID=UPI00123D48DE|nr:alpha/beta hydrolase-fold protein [Nesterenkonia ebinurensis]